MNHPSFNSFFLRYHDEAVSGIDAAQRGLRDLAPQVATLQDSLAGALRDLKNAQDRQDAMDEAMGPIPFRRELLAQIRRLQVEKAPSTLSEVIEILVGRLVASEGNIRNLEAAAAAAARASVDAAEVVRRVKKDILNITDGLEEKTARRDKLVGQLQGAQGALESESRERARVVAALQNDLASLGLHAKEFVSGAYVDRLAAALQVEVDRLADGLLEADALTLHRGLHDLRDDVDDATRRLVVMENDETVPRHGVRLDRMKVDFEQIAVAVHGKSDRREVYVFMGQSSSCAYSCTIKPPNTLHMYIVLTTCTCGQP